MSTHPLVSSIIVFKNAERFIREAIDSVLAQTYDNWELLLVDDGSSDGSTEVAQDYERRHPQKLRYLEHEGHGNLHISASRNLGAGHARGEYMAFLDADDFWFPQKLERQVTLMQANPRAGMIYGDTLYWYSWTGLVEDAGRDYLPPLGVEPDTLIEPPYLLSRFIRNVAFIPCPCSIMVRTSVLREVGGFEAEFCRVTRGMYEDQAFYAKVCRQWPVYVSRECWDRYRRHDDSACAQEKKTGAYVDSRLTYLTWLEAYLTANGVRRGKVWGALQGELLAYRSPLRFRLREAARRAVKRFQQRAPVPD